MRRRRQNEWEERDPELHKTCKGKQWYHRCAEAKAYWVDSESGLIH